MTPGDAMIAEMAATKTIMTHATLMLAMLAISTTAIAQQPSIIDQIDKAIAMERVTANTALGVKDQRIEALQQKIEELKKAAAECKPKAENKAK